MTEQDICLGGMTFVEQREDGQVTEYWKHQAEMVEKRKADKASKWSDETIQDVIEQAWNCSAEAASGYADVAMAMIAYNNMIDKRWESE